MEVVSVISGMVSSPNYHFSIAQFKRLFVKPTSDVNAPNAF